MSDGDEIPSDHTASSEQANQSRALFMVVLKPAGLSDG
jgi:hypothetical protein